MAKQDLSVKSQCQRGGSLKSFDQVSKIHPFTTRKLSLWTLDGQMEGMNKAISPAAEATKNLRRFGQSIKRVVREVKEDSAVCEPRDVLVARNEQLITSIRILSESYQLSIESLVTLHNKYLRSKEVKNIVNRYNLLRDMIKDVGKNESSWWARIDLPKQNRAESFGAYVLRVCSSIEKLRVPVTPDANAFKESDVERDTRHEKINEMTSKQVNDENETLSNTMYKLLKKYQAIRSILKTLQQEYQDSKIYPMFPRYSMLKDMIKSVTHHPDYMEHRHESRIQPD